MSRTALEWAVEEAERRGCAVEVVTGRHLDVGVVVGAVPLGMMVGMLPDETRTAQQEVLDKAVAGIATSVEIRTVPAKVEAKLALTTASEHAQLLVVGRRGLNPVMTALLGSVSSYCVHHASCPVVVVNDVVEPVPERAPGAGVPITPGPLY